MVPWFGIQKSWPVSLALSVEVFLVYLNFSEVSCFCYMPQFLTFLYWLNADFNVYLHTTWHWTCHVMFITCYKILFWGWLLQRGKIWCGRLPLVLSRILVFSQQMCCISLSCIILRSFIWYIKNHPALFSKTQYNLLRFLIVILFVVSCTVRNLITLLLEQEVHSIISMNVEIIITLTCPGPERALGSEVC